MPLLPVRVNTGKITTCKFLNTCFRALGWQPPRLDCRPKNECGRPPRHVQSDRWLYFVFTINSLSNTAYCLSCLFRRLAINSGLLFLLFYSYCLSCSLWLIIFYFFVIVFVFYFYNFFDNFLIVNVSFVIDIRQILLRIDRLGSEQNKKVIGFTTKCCSCTVNIILAYYNFYFFIFIIQGFQYSTPSLS